MVSQTEMGKTPMFEDSIAPMPGVLFRSHHFDVSRKWYILLTFYRGGGRGGGMAMANPYPIQERANVDV